MKRSNFIQKKKGNWTKPHKREKSNNRTTSIWN